MAEGGNAGGPMSWIATTGKGGLKKVAYLVLEWINKMTGANISIPGSGKQSTSPSDFMSTLKNGALLCQLGNVLQPGAIGNIFAGNCGKEKETSNINSFLNFAKTAAGVPDANLFTSEDLQQGKNFPQVLNTLVSVAGNAKDKFGKDGLNPESLATTAAAEAGKGFMSNLFNKFTKK